MAANTTYFDATQYDFSAQKKIDNFLTPYMTYVEATAIKRKDNQTWDVFFNQFDDQLEHDHLVSLADCYEDPAYGLYLLNAPEEVVEDRFRDWAENVLMQFRRQRND